MRVRFSAACAALLLASGCAEAPTAPVDSLTEPVLSGAFESGGVAFVESGLDSGPESLRSALALAEADPTITQIRFTRRVTSVALSTPLVFSGTQDLVLAGNDVTVDASGCDCDALTFNGGGGVTLFRINVNGAGGHGVVVDVPGSATGVINVELNRVTLAGNGLSGMHVDDQAGGPTGTGADSDAGLRVSLKAVQILDNGFKPGFDDYDGIRVDEGGNGSVELLIARTSALGNAGDGIEVDEIGSGDVTGVLRDSSFDGNGEQPQLPSDLEDGFDVDEAGAGSIVLRFVRVTANDNYDEGIDLDEDGAGDIDVDMAVVEASRNLDEGIKFTEDENDTGGGDVLFRLANVTANGNGDDGAQLEEFGDDGLEGRIVNSTFNDNGNDGLKPEQDAGGEGRVILINVTAEGNAGDPVDPSGVTVITRP